jgi:beta-phosphoglucomutase
MIFDLDGTLADTEPLHFAAFCDILRRLGVALGRDEYFTRLIGFNDRDCFTAVLTERGVAYDEKMLAGLIAAKAGVYQAMIADQDVLYPGAVEFVRRCAARFPLSIATGTLRDEAEMILRRGRIRDYFLDIVAAEDVEHGKPAPDGFLAALGRLGFILRPRPSLGAGECLVIEDTAAGVAAARRAGMRVLAVSQSPTAADLAGADLVRPSLAATDLDEVLHVLAAR